MFKAGRSKLKSTINVESPIVKLDQVMIDGLLTNTIVNLESNVSTLETNVTNLEADVATKTSELATANSTILDLQDQLENCGGPALETYITDLNDAQWTFFPGQTSGIGAKPQSNFLDSYLYDAQTKTHTFTTKSITVADESYAINTGATFGGPKWYKLATYDDGSPVMIGDSFSLSVRIDNCAKDGIMNNYLFALDLFEWPYINDNNYKLYLNFQRPVGFYHFVGATSQGFGTHVNNNVSVGTNNSGAFIEGVGSVVTPGGAQNSARPTYVSYWNGSNIRNVTGNTVYHTASSTVGQLYLGLLVSSNGASTTTGGVASMRFSYSIGKLK